MQSMKLPKASLGRRCAVAAALLALGAAGPTPAQSLPYMNPSGLHVEEGDAGTSTHVVSWQLSAPATAEVRFKVKTDVSRGLSATPGVDFVVIPPTQIVVPVGETSGTIAVQVIGDTDEEPHEMFDVLYYDFEGALAGPSAYQTDNVSDILIRNDDEDPVALVAMDDHHVFLVDEALVLHPGENDFDDPFNHVLDTITTILAPPQYGTLTPGYDAPGADPFVYTPGPGFTGRDRFRYRLCKAGGVECSDATVHLQGALRTPHGNPDIGGRTGVKAITFTNLPALTDGRYVASNLARGTTQSMALGVDATPRFAWDSADGWDFVTRTLPASEDGLPVEHRIVVKQDATWLDDVELRVGVDTDGNGQPSADEQRCVSTPTPTQLVECDVPVTVAGAPVTYWVAQHSREAEPVAAAVLIHELRMDDPSTRLLVTGPVTAAAGEAVTLRPTWRDLTGLDPMMAFVRVFDGDVLVGEFRLDGQGGAHTRLLVPTDASPLVFDLPPNGDWWIPDRGLFFDVPRNAASVSITVRGDQSLKAGLYWFGYPDRLDSTVVEAPASTPTSEYASVPAGQSRTITVTDPMPGRWYALVMNDADARARIELTADIDAPPAVIRPGSYFNSGQPGHGLLLYPAADQWAGLWYTYMPDGRPTWYYLQAPQPGADGIWRSPIYRDVWNGTAARHAVVGEMTLTPRTADGFMASYVIEGNAGSQLMDALGRGCPTSAGGTIDISSHWFDPVRAGNGYSVQTWDSGYQFFAAFAYDRQGWPVFLAAERPDLGGEVAELSLEYLDGSCPTGCQYQPPIRMPAGTLRRTLAGGTLSEIALDVDYAELAPFGGRNTFSVRDHVQLLGGPGSTQGCAP